MNPHTRDQIELLAAYVSATGSLGIVTTRLLQQDRHGFSKALAASKRAGCGSEAALIAYKIISCTIWASATKTVAAQRGLPFVVRPRCAATVLVSKQVTGPAARYRAAKSKRSRFMTLFQAATKSRTNFSSESPEA